jgi:hypothetical protein
MTLTRGGILMGEARAERPAAVVPEGGRAYGWRAALHLLPNIRFGTEGYPEKVARRLRGVNIAAWLSAIMPSVFVIVRALDGRWLLALDNALTAAAFASVPLLHRFGQAVAPTVLAIFFYIHIFRVVKRMAPGVAYGLPM